jgi:hypothetical protein
MSQEMGILLQTETAPFRNRMSMNQEANPLMIWVIRLIHTLIALIGIAATAIIYLSAISQTYNLWLYLSLGALLIEVIAVILNRGDCPFLFVSRKYGDDKKLLELFLPKNVAKRMFKVIFIVILIGYLLLLFRFLF